MSARLALLLAIAAGCAPVFAQSPAAPPARPLPAWDQLSAADREALIAPIRERWDNEPAQRARMLQHAKRWRTMTPEQRKAAHDGMRRWSHMDPEQREHARALYVRMRGMDAEERRALRAQWGAMTPEQRKAWLDAHPPVEAPQAPPH